MRGRVESQVVKRRRRIVRARGAAEQMQAVRKRVEPQSVALECLPAGEPPVLQALDRARRLSAREPTRPGKLVSQVLARDRQPTVIEARLVR